MKPIAKSNDMNDYKRLQVEAARGPICGNCAHMRGEIEGAYRCVATKPAQLMTHPANKCIIGKFKLKTR